MNTFGRIFRINIFGESHGASIGVVIDGCNCGIDLQQEDFMEDLSRRKAGAEGTTPRKENDLPQIISGVYNGKTTGSPIAILFENKNTNSKDYDILKDTPRPGHADFTAFEKYKGFNDPRGGGHFSGRLTLALVAAGVIAKKIIPNIKIEAKLISVGGSTDIEKTVKKAIAENDSIGGLIHCTVSNLPIGLGDPFFDSVESLISHLVFAIPAIKGIEFGSGFDAASMKGSNHNDLIITTNGITKTNYAGGINGGITNGNNLEFKVAVKPTSSIAKEQQTINLSSGKIETLAIKGRHDACIALRMPVIIEAAIAIVLADLLIINKNIG